MNLLLKLAYGIEYYFVTMPAFSLSTYTVSYKEYDQTRYLWRNVIV